MWNIFTTFLCLVASCTATRQEYGLCSQVYLMSQYCSINDVPPAHSIRVARGPAGKPGRPGIVNYTKVEEKIAPKINVFENNLESKFEEYETTMNRTVSRIEKELEKKFESKFEEYETIMNRTVSRLKKEVEEKFEFKFKEYETIMNRTVSRHEKELGKKFETQFEEYQTIINSTVSKLKKEVEKKFESKFGEYETIMNRTVSRLEKELEKKFESKFEEYETIMNKTVSRHEKAEARPPTTSCDDAKLDNAKVKNCTDGVFHIDANDIDVFCDLTTDGGRWTVFQRRLDGSQNFNQNWSNYVSGFGDLTGEFWLGLEKIHLLTQGGTYELRVELTDQNDRIGIANYQTFSVSGSSENYRLNVGGFSGTGVGDKLTWHNNMAFTTKDRDNDRWGGNCAAQYSGGWWFKSCRYSMLNKPYRSIYWGGFNNIKKTEMKFRKK